MAKTQARTSKQKPNHVKKINFFTSYNPSLPYMNTHFKKYLHLLHNNDSLKTLFPTETFNVVYRRKKNLKELLTLSLFPFPTREKYSCGTTILGKIFGTK